MSSLFDKEVKFKPLNSTDETEAALAKKENEHVITQAHFSCKNCGSDLIYSPASQDLVCRSCGHHYPVHTKAEPIKEVDFKQALKELDRLQHNDPKNANEIPVIQCPSCGAEFSFKQNEHAGECPYCATPVITDTSYARFIEPKSLLPFKFEKKQAIAIFDEWIGSHWFAPSSLKSHSKREEKLVGIYLPYWTYDSQTFNQYRGQRGTTYYDRQVYSTVVNGRRVQRVRTVPRIRWKPVGGQVDIYILMMY